MQFKLLGKLNFKDIFCNLHRRSLLGFLSLYSSPVSYIDFDDKR